MFLVDLAGVLCMGLFPYALLNYITSNSENAGFFIALPVVKLLESCQQVINEAHYDSVYISLSLRLSIPFLIRVISFLS